MCLLFCLNQLLINNPFHRSTENPFSLLLDAHFIPLTIDFRQGSQDLLLIPLSDSSQRLAQGLEATVYRSYGVPVNGILCPVSSVLDLKEALYLHGRSLSL